MHQWMLDTRLSIPVVEHPLVQAAHTTVPAASAAFTMRIPMIPDSRFRLNADTRSENLAGMSVRSEAKQIRMSYVKVIEFPQRGSVHLHALVRPRRRGGACFRVSRQAQHQDDRGKRHGGPSTARGVPETLRLPDHLRRLVETALGLAENPAHENLHLRARAHTAAFPGALSTESGRRESNPRPQLGKTPTPAQRTAANRRADQRRGEPRRTDLAGHERAMKGT